MPLSDEEQRLLAQLEASLAADDPGLASTLRGTEQRRVQPRRAGACIAGFVLGLAALVAGVQLHPLVGVLGFLLMLVSVMVGRSSLQPGPQASQRPARPARPRATQRPRPGAGSTDDPR